MNIEGKYYGVLKTDKTVFFAWDTLTGDIEFFGNEVIKAVHSDSAATNLEGFDLSQSISFSFFDVSLPNTKRGAYETASGYVDLAVFTIDHPIPADSQVPHIVFKGKAISSLIDMETVSNEALAQKINAAFTDLGIVNRFMSQHQSVYSISTPEFGKIRVIFGPVSLTTKLPSGFLRGKNLFSSGIILYFDECAELTHQQAAKASRCVLNVLRFVLDADSLPTLEIVLPSNKDGHRQETHVVLRCVSPSQNLPSFIALWGTGYFQTVAKLIEIGLANGTPENHYLKFEPLANSVSETGLDDFINACLPKLDLATSIYCKRHGLGKEKVEINANQICRTAIEAEIQKLPDGDVLKASIGKTLGMIRDDPSFASKIRMSLMAVPDYCSLFSVDKGQVDPLIKRIVDYRNKAFHQGESIILFPEDILVIRRLLKYLFYCQYFEKPSDVTLDLARLVSGCTELDF